MEPYQIALAAITFGAAIVNGALGYGFSSLTVPLALLFLTNRVLNPALIPLEVALNAYVLWVNRAAMPTVWPSCHRNCPCQSSTKCPRFGSRPGQRVGRTSYCW